MSPFDQHQAETAAWMGYPDAAAMNAQHDPLHEALCRWLGVASQSMACARGEPHDGRIAGLEENAVLHLQRFMAHLGLAVPATLSTEHHA